ncbi:MAG: tRNA (N6-threonylcarbamoyladenosine(37)-N6)-methyltransferase TrmO [Clostridia bacterium]|nr:tRNA (N6-threonylcarbamoyladenosine(37)-N6)-methyltransferase TrmO [Clostridia bacterium]
MSDKREIKIIARIHNGFSTKFGVPRQSGLAQSVRSTIVFEPEYRNADALRGIEQFSHIWLIWEFSEAVRDTWSPTVRPPRLGGNKRIGVFATRSPFRPNPIGLSSVKLDSVEHTETSGTILHVSGADLMDGTPIYDIKPYLPYADSHPDATGGFTDTVERKVLQVDLPQELGAKLDESSRAALLEVLSCDPRPSYQNDPERVYGFCFGGREIKFTVRDDVLSVNSIE